ncbi:MAG: helix-turn-helix domain-containing protein [Candidatus Marinimicrobia bacterium]|nr:helix-turn-helix domain-containing protein [Candidatus Neomarinimicrobiota bacterium]
MPEKDFKKNLFSEIFKRKVIMPQMLLPFFPEEITLINELIGFVKKGDYVYYFNGQMPIYLHSSDDYQSFKMFVSQLYICGNASQAEIVRAFGISSSGLKRWVKKYQAEGSSGFFNKRKPRFSPVLTPDRLNEIQELLDEGEDVEDISQKSGVKKNTILKAIQQNRLHRVKKNF